VSEANVLRALTREELDRVAWHISTKSEGGGGNCVEAGCLADGSGRVAVRHSRHPNGAVIVYTRDEWAFIVGVKEGDSTSSEIAKEMR